MPFVSVADGKEYQPMPGPQLLEARLALGLKRLEFGHLLGMTGENRNIYVTVKRYEEGRRDIRPMVERLVLMLLWHKSDFGYLPDLDSGERVPINGVPEFESALAGAIPADTAAGPVLTDPPDPAAVRRRDAL